MNGPIDEDTREQANIREQVRALMQKQKEEDIERKKALQDQIRTITEKQREEDTERKKALQDQINALMQKQKEEDARRKRSIKSHITARMEMAREEHLKRYQQQLEFLQDQGDMEVRKGYLKLHILGTLMKQPSHGYELIHQISHHTGHLWKPSPGSMYPALEALEAKGFIMCQGDGRRKVYSLTPKGENAIDRIRKKHQEQFLEMKAFLSDIFDE